VISFTIDFSKISPEEFVEEYLHPLQVKNVTVGFDFSFGFRGSAKSQDLYRLSKNRFAVKVISSINSNSGKISSTLIREKLKLGRIEEVNHYLGRNYSLLANINARNRGCLTLSAPFILPRSGKYSVQVHVLDKSLPGTLFVGDSDQREGHNDFPLYLHLQEYPEFLFNETLAIELMNSIHSNYDSYYHQAII